MTIWCWSCKRHRPGGEFKTIRKEKVRLWTGHRVKTIRHSLCKAETIVLDSAAKASSKISA